MDTTPDSPERQPALCNVVTHPQHLAFVIRLHRDCDAGTHRLQGRVQHLDSGRRSEFTSLAQLQAWIELQLAGSTRPDTH